MSSLLAGGGDTIHIPKVDEETAVSLTGGAAITYTNTTDGKVDLTVDQHFLSAKRIDDVVKVQQSAGLFEAYAKSMGYALAKKVENYIALLVQTGSGNDVALGADNTFTTAKFREGLQKLLDAGVDYADGNSFMYASPAAYMSLLSLGDFTDANVRGDGQNPHASGKLISAYGIELFASTDWDDDGGTGDETASIFRKESVYFAQQQNMRIQSSYDIDYLATSVVADVLFGAALSHAVSNTALGVVNFNNIA